MDKAAAFAAIRRARSTAVTVAIEDIEFKTPITVAALEEAAFRYPLEYTGLAWYSPSRATLL